MNREFKHPHETICMIDDDPSFGEMSAEFFKMCGYQTLCFTSGASFLEWYKDHGRKCSVIISDVSMPEMTGYELCKSVRSHTPTGLERIPIVLVTGNDPVSEKVKGLESGADDFIQKPFPLRELLAKVESLLRIRADEHEKFELLSRFIPPNIVELLTRRDKDALMKPHRAEVSVVFVDLRKFTAFSEKADPEAVLETLSNFYLAVGNAAIHFNGTLGHLAGDGVMVFFNDPQPMKEYRETAVKMALAVRDALSIQRVSWQEKHYDIDFGIGLSEGFATIGGIGFDKFWQYSVIGSVTNFASRLCGVADKGQILVSRRFLSRMGTEKCRVEELGQVELKGIDKPVPIFNVLAMQSPSL